MHTYIQAYIHTYIHPYIHTYIQTYTHTCMHACHAHAYKQTYIHTSIHTYIHAYRHARVNAHKRERQRERDREREREVGDTEFSGGVKSAWLYFLLQAGRWPVSHTCGFFLAIPGWSRPKGPVSENLPTTPLVSWSNKTSEEACTPQL